MIFPLPSDYLTDIAVVNGPFMASMDDFSYLPLKNGDVP